MPLVERHVVDRSDLYPGDARLLCGRRHGRQSLPAMPRAEGATALTISLLLPGSKHRKQLIRHVTGGDPVISAWSYAGETSTTSAETTLLPARPRRIPSSSREVRPPASGVPGPGACAGSSSRRGSRAKVDSLAWASSVTDAGSPGPSRTPMNAGPPRRVPWARHRPRPATARRPVPREMKTLSVTSLHAFRRTVWAVAAAVVGAVLLAACASSSGGGSAPPAAAGGSTSAGAAAAADHRDSLGTAGHLPDRREGQHALHVRVRHFLEVHLQRSVRGLLATRHGDDNPVGRRRRLGQRPRRDHPR